MKNTYKIIWTDEALENLKSIIDYLANRWTKKEITKFSRLLDHQISLIENDPFLFAETDNSKGIRKSVLSKQTTIYYQISNYEVNVISLFDNRQNPEKKKF